MSRSTPRFVGLVLAIAIGGLPIVPARAATGQTVTFADGNLKACIAERLAGMGHVVSGDITLDELNFITGTLDCSNRSIASLGGIENLTTATRVVLNNNQVTSLGSLPSAEGIELERNLITGFAGMPDLPGLHDLFLGWNQISSVAGMPPLADLTELALNGDPLTTLQGFHAMPKLRALELQDTPLTSLQGLPSLPELQTLNLWGSQLANLQGVPALPKLETAFFAWSQITTLQGMPSFPGLKTLILAGNRISSLQGLPNLASLEHLDIQANGVSSWQGLPVLARLKHLAVGDNEFSSWQGMPTFTNLEHFSVVRNRIGNVAGMPVMPKLQVLDLTENRIWTLQGLPTLASLQELRVGGNQLLDIRAIPSSLGTHYSAWQQVVPLPDTEVGASTPLRVIDREGNELPLTIDPPTGATYTNGALSYTATGTYTITFRTAGICSSHPCFSGTITQTVLGDAPVPALTGPTPLISDTTPVTDQVLTASPGTWGPDPVDLWFQWLRNGTAITGATGPTYVVSPADVGATLRVTVTGGKLGYPTTSKTSATTSPVAKARFTTAPKPKITGTAKVGKTLKAVPGTCTPAASKVTYQWYRGTKAIKAATKPTYKITKADLGKKIKVRITVTRPGYFTISQFSRPTAVVRRA
jgi:Leucine-rich repeat (LRR) protein